MDFVFKPIGVVRSCFSEKFGVPRQSGLIPEATADIMVFPPYGAEASLRGLSCFSHIWIVFVFHLNADGRWSSTVRPPRLGGNRRMGVFATRSGFRPNPVGMSAVRLEKIDRTGDAYRLRVSGIDLVDGTPVLDIKPYLPYADRIEGAHGAYAGEAPPRSLSVTFSPEARGALERIDAVRRRRLTSLIEAVLALDPRPAYRRSDSGRVYGIAVDGIDVRWRVKGTRARVVSIRAGAEPFDQFPEKR
ncbi:MAG: tRNA (N6-threonylcarbamoyladenosine(37)-N6)-methyltransferase TrmO [Desulfobacterales bacterium]|jgi:tRNA-Thr(GGU) m(6)t(6)A37 methyltransferase TsaA